MSSLVWCWVSAIVVLVSSLGRGERMGDHTMLLLEADSVLSSLGPVFREGRAALAAIICLRLLDNFTPVLACLAFLRA